MQLKGDEDELRYSLSVNMGDQMAVGSTNAVVILK